jgi:UDP-3-O-[3-hydroxymyristoyl] glucosamine N-acyltransferase
LSSNQSSNKLIAVSFESATYHDLECFVNEHNDYTLTRISPDDFLLLKTPLPGSYINLVIRDFKLRKQVTEHLDTYHFDRFSIIHNQSYTSCASIALGCMIYPLVSIYPKAVLQRDVLVHSLSLIAHQCKIGVGTFISGGCTVAGNTTIGEFTQILADTTLYDQIAIPANTVIGAGSVVRKSVVESGVYVNKKDSKLTKLR